MPNLTIMSHEEYVIREECRQRRDGWEARYGPRHGCHYGCDGSGWKKLEPGVIPLEMEIYHDGAWWTPCECNMASCNWQGASYRWPRRYPEGYSGHKVGPPKKEAA